MRLLAVLFLICLSGCNSYQKFYTPAASSFLTPPKSYHGQPQVRNVSADEHSSVFADFIDRGYVCLGESSFSSGMNPSQREALSFARKLGADLVILSNSYQRTVSGSYSYTSPTQSTTYHSGNVNTYGSYGSSTGYYSGTSTTYGSQTTTVPYNINRYNYRASFFVYEDALTDWETKEPVDRSTREVINDPEFLKSVPSPSVFNDPPPSVYVPSPTETNRLNKVKEQPYPTEYEANFKHQKQLLYDMYKNGEITKEVYFKRYKLLKSKQDG